MERFAPPRPDHSPPDTLDDEELARTIDSLRRKLQSVRVSLGTARLAGLAVFAVAIAAGFTLLWAGPAAFLPRIFGSGAAVTVPELLVWWGAVIAAALFAGIVCYRLFTHRMRVVRGWKHKADELALRLQHAEAESRRRGTA